MPAENGLKSSPSIAVTDSRPASPTRLPAWATLQTHARRLRDTRTEALFDADAGRPERFRLEHDDLLADFSKQLIDAAVLDALCDLATEAGLPDGIAALFAGEHLNFTEDRPALHMALRGGALVPETDTAALEESSRRMRAFARELREGRARGASGQRIRHVVNLGIGGSDLGPRMACEALATTADAPMSVRFVANIDPLELDEALTGAEPASTLFIVSSKSFSTLETLANARAARAWLRAGLGADADTGAHFAAVSNLPGCAAEFGIAPERVFAVPAWVGGRFSVWSAVGLPVLIALGEAHFDAMLAGAASIDVHFRSAPLAQNIPVMLALAGIWNVNFLGIGDFAALPYAHGLRSFPAWLQQLEMESNGKCRLRDDSAAETHTAPIVFGQAGTVGQHAFHQLLYQGTRRVAVDFIVPVMAHDERSRALFENALAQSEALMTGRDAAITEKRLRASGMSGAQAARLALHSACPGNQPSTTLLLPGLTPRSFGQLLALYEHKTFAQGWIWGINSFDQYGVELGKEMARRIASPQAERPHPATEALLAAIERLRKDG
jgi:glucose-6-phosphate isomerase